MADRIARLWAAIQRQGGEWTTARVMRWYRDAGLAVPKRATARADLKYLTERGHVTLHEAAGRRYYTPAGGGRRG